MICEDMWWYDITMTQSHSSDTVIRLVSRFGLLGSLGSLFHFRTVTERSHLSLSAASGSVHPFGACRPCQEPHWIQQTHWLCGVGCVRGPGRRTEKDIVLKRFLERFLVHKNSRYSCLDHTYFYCYLDSQRFTNTWANSFSWFYPGICWAFKTFPLGEHETAYVTVVGVDADAAADTFLVLETSILVKIQDAFWFLAKWHRSTLLVAIEGFQV